MEALGMIVAKVVLPVIAALVGLGASYAVKQLGSWLNMKAIREYNDDVERLASQAVMAAQGRVRKWATKQGASVDEDSIWHTAVEWLGKKAPKLKQKDVEQQVDAAMEWLGAIGSGAKSQDKSNKSADEGR